MIRAIALDDEPPALSVIEAFCERTDFIDLQKTFSGTVEALKYLRKYPVELIFLDIQMPSMSGIEFSRHLPEDVMVIFTTAFSEYAVEGFNLNAVDYLLKPFTFQRFTQAASKANEIYVSRNKKEDVLQKHLLVNADYSLQKIPFADIVCIEGLDDYLKIHLVSKKTLVTRMTMKSMAERLPETVFVRVHRSFIIPLSRIESVRNKLIYLADKEIPIGNSYAADFFAKFKA
ncbi:MAG: LytR/AlgR family response regulator transcription factor [Bacteroidia bacterium]